MTLIPAFIAMLDNELTSVAINETQDGRYYTVAHLLPGDEQEYRIEYFDGEPVTLGWAGCLLNMAGEIIRTGERR